MDNAKTNYNYVIKNTNIKKKEEMLYVIVRPT